MSNFKNYGDSGYYDRGYDVRDYDGLETSPFMSRYAIGEVDGGMETRNRLRKQLFVELVRRHPSGWDDDNLYTLEEALGIIIELAGINVEAGPGSNPGKIKELEELVQEVMTFGQLVEEPPKSRSEKIGELYNQLHPRLAEAAVRGSAILDTSVPDARYTVLEYIVDTHEHEDSGLTVGGRQQDERSAALYLGSYGSDTVMYWSEGQGGGNFGSLVAVVAKSLLDDGIDPQSGLQNHIDILRPLLNPSDRARLAEFASDVAARGLTAMLSSGGQAYTNINIIGPKGKDGVRTGQHFEVSPSYAVATGGDEGYLQASDGRSVLFKSPYGVRTRINIGSLNLPPPMGEGASEPAAEGPTERPGFRERLMNWLTDRGE